MKNEKHMSQQEKDVLGALAARLVKRYPKDQTITLRRTTSVVFSVEALAWLDAFAKHTGESRSAVAGQIVEAGIQQVVAKLDDDSRRHLEALRLVELDRLVKEMGKKTEGELFEQEG
jgi:hypothetical protein